MTASIVSKSSLSVLSAPGIPAGAPLKRRLVSDDVAAPSNKKQRTVHKRVRFQPTIDVRHVSRFENDNVWYTPTEFREGRILDHKLKACYPEITEAFRQALSHLVASSNGDSGVVPAPILAAHNPLRGNETEMLPYFSQRRKQVIANVMKSQQSMVAYKRSNPAKAAKADLILAGHYRKLSAPALQFARLLAEGDAVVAHL